MNNIIKNTDWSILLNYLPDGWIEECISRGALQRCRKIKNPEALLRVILMHAVSGESLRTTVVRAKHAGICDISDVALLKRLKSSERWLAWIVRKLSEDICCLEPPSRLKKRFRLCAIDSTVVKETAINESDWRVHYSIRLDTISCNNIFVTDIHTGESFRHHAINPDDIFVADRGYCRSRDISYVADNNGYTIVRYHWNGLSIYSRTGKKINILSKLESLKTGEIGDWDVWVRHPKTNELIKGRLCAIRKQGEALEKSIKKARRKSAKNCCKLRPETLKYATYVIVFTTVSRRWLKKEYVMNIFRDRWQIEVVFKRLKGLMKLGTVPKIDPLSCRSWLHAKLLIALLVERLHREAEFFSPWGYTLGSTTEKGS
jgi:hypothetical protein